MARMSGREGGRKEVSKDGRMEGIEGRRGETGSGASGVGRGKGNKNDDADRHAPQNVEHRPLNSPFTAAS
jgi:hypothetical protein